MSFQYEATLNLGPSKPAVTLHAQLWQPDGSGGKTLIGSVVTTGFTTSGNGNYLLVLTVPDGYIGAFDVFDAAAPSVVLVTGSIGLSDGPVVGLTAGVINVVAASGGNDGGYRTVRMSEKVDIVVTIPGISTVNSGSVTLYDSAGNVAGGIDAAGVTGKSVPDTTNAIAWWRFVPLTLSIPAGLYSLAFVLSITSASGSDVSETVVKIVLQEDWQ